MDHKLFGPKRRQVDLGGTGSSHASATSLVQAREQRERRERSRQEGLAAVKIQSVFRGHCSRRYTRAANAQRYDLVILDCNSLIPATQLLLASDQNAARYAAWCRFVVSSKSIFTPFESGSPSQWLSLLKRIARQLLSLASELPNAPQSTLFLEVIRILVDSKKYPQKFAQYAQELTRFLITSGLYLQLRAHILAIAPDQSTKAPSLPSAVNLSLTTIAHFDQLPPGFIDFLSIPLLTQRVPHTASKSLSNGFPLQLFLQHFARLPQTKLEIPTAANLLANCTPFIIPKLQSMKWIDVKGYLSFLRCCLSSLPTAYFKPPDPADMDVDETVTANNPSDLLQTLTSSTHINAVLTASRSSSASRPALAELVCSLIPLLPSRSTEDFLTVLAYSPSAGSGLVRELLRMIRTYSVSKLGATKESWKEVIRSLQDSQNTEGWSLLLLLVLIYTRLLRSMGDDAFYPSSNLDSASTDRNPLQLEDVRSLAELARNIAFALYWNPPERLRVGRINLDGIRDTFRKLAVALHERDSRRKFLPDELFSMTSAGAFEVSNFIESALQEDQRLQEEEEESQRQVLTADHRTESDEEDADASARRRVSMKGRFSRREIAMISPRLGLLNNLPFIIPFETRVLIFRHFIASDYSRLPPSFNSDRAFMGGRATFRIRRGHVAEDGFKLNNLNGQELKRQLAIQFYDQFDQLEAGIDGGGLFKEFLTDLCKEAFDINRGLWRTNSRLELFPAPSAYAKDAGSLQWFRFLGKIIGKSLYEGILVSVPFAGFFFSKWLGKQSFLDDLASLDPELYNGLVQLKNYKGDVADLSLTFAVDEDDLGLSRTVPLIPGGTDVAVTNENRNAYIARVCHYYLNIRIKEQCSAFVAGLQEVISPRWLRLFSVSELRMLVEGADQPVDVDDLRVNTVYAGLEESSPTITYFWNVLSEMDASQRKAFLRFVTSADKAPLLGFKELNPRFAIRASGEDTTRLPSASTCVNMLKLPPYTSKQTLKQKLIMAIEAQAGFDLS